MVYLIAFAAFVVLDILLLYAVIKSYMLKTRGGNMLGTASICFGLVLWAYALNYFCADRDIMAFACCFQSVCIIWGLYFSMLFVYDFIKRPYSNSGVRIISLAMIMIDSALVITSPINGLAMTIEYRHAARNDMAVAEPGFFFYMHIVLCAAVAFTMVVLLIGAMLKAARCYALKYIIVLVIIFFLTIPKLILILNENAVHDYSSVFYGIAGAAFYYALYMLSPVVMLGRFQGFMSEVMSDAILLYDMDGSLLNSGDIAEGILGMEAPKKEIDLIEGLKLPGTESTIRSLNGNNYNVIRKFINDKNSRFVATAYVFHDITETEKLIAKEHREGTTDELTGAYNRRGFIEAAEAHLETIRTGGYVLMISAVDNFKSINRMYGTRIGDEVLKAISAKIAGYAKDFPVIYGRSAESKFIILFPLEETDKLLSEMASFKVPIPDGRKIAVDMRHGFVIMSEDRPLEDYYELAIAAFVKSKKNEGFSVVEYSEDILEENEKRQSMLSDMEAGLENREFMIEFRPHVSVATGRIVGARALVHWMHPRFGRIESSEFVDIFEEGRVISKLDEYVWETVAENLERLKGAGRFDGYFSVEVNRLDITAGGLPEKLSGIMEKYGIRNEQIHLIIRKCSEGENRASIVKTLETLKDMGFVIEEADFGKGKSLVAGILTLPYNVEIVDIKFVRESFRTDHGKRALKEFINMIHAMGCLAYIVGISCAEDMEMVKELDVDEIEGDYVFKPLQLKEFIGVLKKGK